MPTYDADGFDENGRNANGEYAVRACFDPRCVSCEWLAPLVIPAALWNDRVREALHDCTEEAFVRFRHEPSEFTEFLRRAAAGQDEATWTLEDNDGDGDPEYDDDDEEDLTGNPDDEGVLSCSVNPCDFLGWKAFDKVRYKPGDALLSFEFECEPARPSSLSRTRAISAVIEPMAAAYRAEVGHTTRRSRGGIIVCRDGSLSEYGMEFKTVPMTLEEHRRVLRRAFPDGVFGGGTIRAWSMHECGMHVHQSCPRSNWHIGKSLAFHMQPANQAFLVGIAGRLANTYCQASMSHAHVLAGKMAVEARFNAQKYLTQRYKHNPNWLRRTLETRAFRPSKRIDVMLKNLCFVLASRQFTHLASGAGKVKFRLGEQASVRWSHPVSTDYPGLHWQEFLRWLSLTPHRKSYVELHQWLLRTTTPASADQRVAPFRRFYMNLFNNKPGLGR